MLAPAGEARQAQPGAALSEDGEQITQETTLRPGVYRLTVHDLSDRHNFHLLGPDGLDEEVATVPFVGDVTVKIQVKHGTVTFRCDPHSATMHGSFEVGGVVQA
jgi:hypothetical protein